MTPPPDPSELASALVDGVLPDDEAAAAAADPEVAALAAELQALRAELRDLPPAPDLGRATAVAAALDAVAQDDAAYQLPGDGAPPPPAQFPRQTRPWTRQPWLVAAASVVALVLAVGLITRLGDGDDSEDLASTSAEDNTEAEDSESEDLGALDPGTVEDRAEADAEAGAADRSDGDEAETDSQAGADESPGEVAPEADVPEVLDLGTVDSPDELVVIVRQHHSGEAPVPDLRQADIVDDPSCRGDYGPGGDPARGGADLSGLAWLDGEPVWVHLYLAPAGRVGNLMAFDDSCERVLDRTVDL